jgi:hypothetical protein
MSSPSLAFPFSIGHGRYGTENRLDRAYFIMHLEWITAVLKESIDFYEKDMDEVKDKKRRPK